MIRFKRMVKNTLDAVKFRYIYEAYGEIVPKFILENDIWVDVGNKSADGVFDHHQNGGLNSALETILTCSDHFEGLKKYLSANKEGSPEVVFHVHECPDIDCVLSVYVIQKMIRDNAPDPRTALKDNTADALIKYVNEIDKGRKKVMSSLTLYSYFCKIGTRGADNETRSKEIMEEGIILMEMVVNALNQSGQEIDLFVTPIQKYLDISRLRYYKTALTDLERARKSYQNDKQGNRVKLGKVMLWNKAKNSPELVKAAIWEKQASDEDQYIFARDDDQCLLTVYYPEMKKEETTETETTRVLIALNPNLTEASDYTLLPLAEILEQFEQIEEEKMYRETGRYRRDHSKARDTSGLFASVPFSETSDPWYISKEEDMIDAPRIRSLLPYDRILSIIRNSSSEEELNLNDSNANTGKMKMSTMTKTASLVSYREKNGTIYMESSIEFGETSYGKLYQNIQSKLSEMKETPQIVHLLALVRIDPLMLRNSNDMLRSCCLNMVGKADSIMNRDNFRFINYRSCLYTDRSITIIATADSVDQKTDIINGEISFTDICQDIRNILEHRQELRDIGAGLSEKIETIDQKTAEIDELNSRIVRLNTRIETDNLITAPLEQDIYDAIKESLQVDELRESVVTSANLLIKNAEQKRDRALNQAREEQKQRKIAEEKKERERDELIQAGIGLVTILAVFSALVDSFDFIAKFIPGKEGGWTDVSSCIPVLVVEILTFLLIIILGFIAGKYALQAFLGAKSDD